jgi:hypothetical protein
MPTRLDRTKQIETTASGLATHAREFQRAADALIAVHPQPAYLTIPVHYLYGHAIELALKAFLRHRGVDPEKTRNKIGHDLGLLVERVLAEDPADPFGLVGNRQLMIDHLNKSYGLKAFEYRNVIKFRLVQYVDLQAITTHLVARVHRILRAERRARPPA